ncbi:alpha/beta hydrolase fold domain-containing protein [Paenibacillus sp. 5J-6]|uniref:Alpha/beta hydrolase fold domain-containing protein n=1 Tax=Paenibacillus silvestris TaxID=2606219 RepID=A0A6L8VBU4_9BACL|nr:alpha/beta hydrolase [Paenibacillus silvestris]MZQ87112.1 alpha/beta hydrolase fold domain-containing protein [Paenibacillus silvestris]
MGKESIQSRFIKAGLRFIQVNAIWKKTGEALRIEVENRQRKESYEPPKNMLKKYDCHKYEANGHAYYVVRPLEQAHGSKHIFYLHGGGNVLKISSLHWEFIAYLVDRLACTVTVPMYPLAPEHTHEDVFEMLVPLYRELSSDVQEQDLVVMGDSARGGMSLALAQLLRDRGLKQPGNIILISPLLDMTFSHPMIRMIEKQDPISATPALHEIAKWYAGEESVKHYLVSPIHGNFHDLGRISVYIGTHDILYPDANKFSKLAGMQGIPMNYYEYPSMLHVWPLFPCPEAKKAREQMIHTIESTS